MTNHEINEPFTVHLRHIDWFLSQAKPINLLGGCTLKQTFSFITKVSLATHFYTDNDVSGLLMDIWG